MADKIKFELVSPERLLMSTRADLVVVPGTEGDFGAMAGHMPLVATIRPGIVEVHDGDLVTRLFVRGGLAEVSRTSLTILAEEAIALADVELADLEQQLRNIQEDINDARDAQARAAAEAAYQHLKQVRDAKAAA
ncbi:MAG: F0F1 ATP synthase subunit epsilon [Sphingomonadales bacterium]